MLEDLLLFPVNKNRTFRYVIKCHVRSSRSDKDFGELTFSILLRNCCQLPWSQRFSVIFQSSLDFSRHKIKKNSWDQGSCQLPSGPCWPSFSQKNQTRSKHRPVQPLYFSSTISRPRGWPVSSYQVTDCDWLCGGGVRNPYIRPISTVGSNWGPPRGFREKGNTSIYF